MRVATSGLPTCMCTFKSPCVLCTVQLGLDGQRPRQGTTAPPMIHTHTHTHSRSQTRTAIESGEATGRGVPPRFTSLPRKRPARRRRTSRRPRRFPGPACSSSIPSPPAPRRHPARPSRARHLRLRLFQFSRWGERPGPAWSKRSRLVRASRRRRWPATSIWCGLL